MQKLSLYVFLVLFFFNINFVNAGNIKHAYFAGGCFWCMEESFEKASGVRESFQAILEETYLIQPIKKSLIKILAILKQ